MRRAGALATTVEILEATETTIAFGDQDALWTPVATRRASVRPTTGRQDERADRRTTETSIEVRMRRDPGLTITPRHRLRLGARLLDVVAVLDVEERRREWVLICRETT